MATVLSFSKPSLRSLAWSLTGEFQNIERESARAIFVQTSDSFLLGLLGFLISLPACLLYWEIYLLLDLISILGSATF